MNATTLELIHVPTTPEEALAQNGTAAELWREMNNLNILDQCPNPRKEAFYKLVEVTPAIIVPTECLPEDLRSTGYVLIVKNEGQQPGKAYKVRGAKNALLGREDGVVGIGAGNAVATKTTSPDTRVLISQMEGSEAILKALAGEYLDPKTFVKSCDGAAVLNPGKIPMDVISDPFFVDEVSTVSKGEVGEAMTILAGVHEVPEPAGALALALALKKMRKNPLCAGHDEPEVIVAVTSGVMVTPDKVREFMSAALAEGLITGTTAYNVLSQAQSERTITGLDEIVARQEADRKRSVSKEVRDDATTRGRVRTVGTWLMSGFTAEYRLFSEDPTAQAGSLANNRARVSSQTEEWHREELADWGVELLAR